MTQADWLGELKAEQRGIQKALSATLRCERGIPARLRAAMRHSLLAGGKRLRPVLALWTWDAAAAGRRRTPVDREAVLAAACGLEMPQTWWWLLQRWRQRPRQAAAPSHHAAPFS